MESGARDSLSVAFAGQGTFRNLPAVCPHCGSVAVFSLVVQAGVLVQGCKVAGISTVGLECGRCPGCSGLVIGVHLDYQDHHVPRVIWPHPVPPDKSPDGLDPDCRSAYAEARKVLALSPMAAAVLARRCLQRVIRAKLRITKKNLFDEIEEAVKREELSKPTRDALDHVRTIGNWAAHPVEDQASTIIDVSAEQAEYTLRVLELLFNDLYVVPEKTAAMNAKLKAKK